MTLRKKFGLLIVLVFALVTLVVSLLQAHWVRSLVISQAEQRMRQNIHAAWNVLEDRGNLLEAHIESLSETAAGLESTSLHEMQSFLEHYRERWELDVLTLLNSDGTVYLRSDLGTRGDKVDLQAMLDALDAKETVSGFVVLPPALFENGRESLHERLRAKDEYQDAMLLFAATRMKGYPEKDGCVLVSGILLNSAAPLLERIQYTIFPNEFYKGKRVGTATIFLGRVRIATTVLLQSGERAVGTLVSDEVAEQVLNRGEPWTGPAFVVSDWYVSRYDPIRDPSGKIIGMLYIGELAQIYKDIQRNTLIADISTILAVMALALALILWLVERILKQIGALDRATELFAAGDLSARAHIETSDELGALARSFNTMAQIIEDDRNQIVRQKEMIEAANRSYMGMLGFATHELRNSIGAAILNVKLLKDGSFGELKDDVPEGVDIIEQSLAYMEDISDNYLQLSRIERGELNVSKSRVKLVHDVLEPTLRNKAGALETKGMRVDVAVANDTVVQADVNLLRIVYDNLIGNAIKYGCDHGRIELDASPQNGHMVLSVWNEGKPIDPDHLARLFEKFQRYDVEESTGKRGTGLGLFIVRNIISNHDGTIWAESEEGKGTRFSFSLPMH